MSDIETIQISIPKDSFNFLIRVSEAANVTVDQACSVIVALAFVRDTDESKSSRLTAGGPLTSSEIADGSSIDSTPAESGTVPPKDG